MPPHHRKKGIAGDLLTLGVHHRSGGLNRAIRQHENRPHEKGRDEHRQHEFHEGKPLSFPIRRPHRG